MKRRSLRIWVQTLQPRRTLIGAIALWLAASSLPVQAAERVVLRYRIFQRSISVEELTTFAETGETSRKLQRYLEVSGQDPEQVRQALNRETEMDVVLLDRALNSFMGDTLLDQIGTFAHTPSGEANREAMRSALVLSASDDNRVSLIEVIQNYPTAEMHVNGDRVMTAYQEFISLNEQVESILSGVDLPFELPF